MTGSTDEVVTVSSGRRGFLSSILTLASGSTLAQIITLAAIPFITRLYDPAAFGMFSVFVALTTVLISISSLQFAEVVVIARTPREADQALVAGGIVALLICALTALSLWLCADAIARQLGFAEYGFLLHLASAVVLLGGLRQIMRRWLLREHRPGKIAISEVGMAVADRAATLGLAIPLSGSPLGLVIGRVAGFVAGLLLVLRPRNVRAFTREPGQYRPRELLKILRRYQHFVVHSWGVLLENIGQQLPVLMVSALLGPAVAGGFALARRVLAEPAIVLGAALAQSYYQHAAREENPARLAEVTHDMTAILLKCIAFPAIIALGCAPEIFPVVFGAAWFKAGWYTLILGPVFMAYFILRPLNHIFNITERQREKGLFALQNIVVITLTLSLAVVIGNELVVLSVFSFCSTVFLAYRACWLLSLVGVNLPALHRDIIFSLGFTLAAAALQLGLRHSLEFGTSSMLLTSACLCVLYLATVWRDRRVVTVIRTLRKS